MRSRSSSQDRRDHTADGFIYPGHDLLPGDAGSSAGDITRLSIMSIEIRVVRRERSFAGNVFSLATLDEFGAVLDAIEAGARSQGLPCSASSVTSTDFGSKQEISTCVEWEMTISPIRLSD